jgi:hypothetical protein
MPTNVTQTEARRLYEEQTRRLLTLPESSEADALRDAMDATWQALTNDERDEVGRFAARLLKERA